MTCAGSHSHSGRARILAQRILSLSFVWTSVLGPCSSRICHLVRQRSLREVPVTLRGGIIEERSAGC